ncbi:hypothetical protein QKW60_20765 [Defluviimonas aestuarii]|uniref:substrate-binding periplasmic protein n=1 Tax=Albidovulum aestuarii TaxID=1130726 RepID=UPI00249CDC2D|nr:hypothetical protein [Defluviimonas aestuarii]MDI3338850.1 hypothetical protein [Defluviimonas aestuarii]
MDDYGSSGNSSTPPTNWKNHTILQHFLLTFLKRVSGRESAMSSLGMSRNRTTRTGAPTSGKASAHPDGNARVCRGNFTAFLAGSWQSAANAFHTLALVALVLFSQVFASTPAVAESVVITTLEWPPYTSAELPKGGATTEVVRQAFAAAGLETEVRVLPWKRAISDAKDDVTVAAYYPGYHCRHVEGFVASDSIGTGPLGFAENVDAPVEWVSIDDIGEQKLKVGTVLGYANTDEFDEKAGTGWVRAIPAPDDVTNLRKLMLKRIDMAVIDKLVMSYLLATEPTLRGAGEVLKFDSKTLEDKTLFVCFNDNEAGHAIRDRFNAGLSKIDIDDIVERYFAEEF